MRLVRLEIDMVAIDPLLLPPYVGSTIRGAMGYALKACACQTGGCDDKHCEWPETCAFGALYHSPVPETAPGRITGGDSAPPPAIVHPPPRGGLLNPGESLTFEYRLFGERGREHLDDLVIALERVGGQRGLGRGRGDIELRRVTDVESGRTVYSPDRDRLALEAVEPTDVTIQNEDLERTPDASPKAVEISSRTPLSLKRESSERDDELLDEDDLDFGEFVHRAVERYRELGTCWGASPEQVHEHGPDKDEWRRHARGELDVRRVDSTYRALEAEDLERYSHPQDDHHPLPGIMGRWRFEGEVGPFVKLLEIGELLHIGARTGFGYGAYDLEVEFE